MVAGAVAAVVLMVSLMLLSDVSIEVGAFYACIWWVGVIVGVSLCVPVVIKLVSVHTNIYQKITITIMSFLVAVLVLIMLFYAHQHKYQSIKEQLNHIAVLHAEHIKKQLSRMQDSLISVERFYASSNFVDRQEFQTFTHGVLSEGLM